MGWVKNDNDMQENGQAAFGRLKEEAGRRRGKGEEGGDLCEEMGKMKGVSFCSTEREVWYEGARRAIEARIRAATNSNGAGSGGGGVGGGGNIPPSAVARGVVLFVGDGMGMSTLTAARILSGQRHGNTGEEAQLAWDSFPAVALSRFSLEKSSLSQLSLINLVIQQSGKTTKCLCEN
ncbi:hypothetical protein M0802_013139 [Mischocyttarus mexicanus]|nr:hypothetical protein M0802_013139 [Mischocyttarus mexicanus]